jgi:glycosyltransferase involved in cell wall biosynthesis
MIGASDPLQVVHVGKFYPPVRGGMERVLASLCEGPAGQVESRVIVFNTSWTTVRENVRGVGVTRVATVGAAGSVPIAPSFPAELRRARGDLMVVHEPNPWALLSLAVARPALPTAVWFHSEVVRPWLQYALFYHPLARPVYERARRIVVSSPLLADHAAALEPYRDRVRVIPFGIDVAEWDATPAIRARAEELRAEAGSRPLILFAGRMVPYKGVGILLRAMVGLDVTAVLVGDGPSRAEWTALARELPLTGRVRFAGDVPHEELVALYHACDIFVLPSVTRAEAFGYVQLEAMACGKPVVSTRLPSGVPWVNRHGETGLTAPPGDVDALRRALAELAADESLRGRFGRAGRLRVESEFTMEIMRSAAAAVYREAVS